MTWKKYIYEIFKENVSSQESRAKSEIYAFKIPSTIVALA
jgi:hypothetical protein